MKSKTFFFFFAIWFISHFGIVLGSEDSFSKKLKDPKYEYECPPNVEKKVWDLVKPHLLPSNHHIKRVLDKIFSDSRVIADKESVECAGFLKPRQRQFSHAIVSKHPKLKDYLVKMYLDSSPICEWRQWLARIRGAKCAQRSIEQHQVQHLFKVPQKWIYPLPARSALPPGTPCKNFILVVENMHVYHRQKNQDRWKSSLMTKERLDALYLIISENGLSDSVYAFNVPFCRDGKQAFIDTEYHHRPMTFERTLQFLSRPMAKYWEQIINKANSQ